MSLISVVASNNFLTLMADGRVTYITYLFNKIEVSRKILDENVQ